MTDKSLTLGGAPDQTPSRVWGDPFGRRNPHPDAASLMRGRLYNMQKARVPNPKGVNQHSEVEYHFDTQPTTADRLSAELGRSLTIGAQNA